MNAWLIETTLSDGSLVYDVGIQDDLGLTGIEIGCPDQPAAEALLNALQGCLLDIEQTVRRH